MCSDRKLQAIIDRVAGVDVQERRDGQFYTETEKYSALTQYRAGICIGEIAQRLGRTPRAIRGLVYQERREGRHLERPSRATSYEVHRKRVQAQSDAGDVASYDQREFAVEVFYSAEWPAYGDDAAKSALIRRLNHRGSKQFTDWRQVRNLVDREINKGEKQ